MQVVNIKVYEYPELTDKAKQKARKSLEDILSVSSNDEILENAKEYLKMQGLSQLCDINFSFSYSQGDGIAFYGFVDLKEYIEKQEIKIKEIIPNIYVKVYKTNSHYDHFNTMGIESNLNEFETSNNVKETDIPDETGKITKKARHEINCIIGDLEEHLKRISKKLEIQSYNIIENNESDKHIAELCKWNNWMFYKNGSAYIPDL
jgi:hypothetical protein